MINKGNAASQAVCAAFLTSAGWAAVVFSSGAVSRLVLPQPDRDEALKLAGEMPEVSEDAAPVKELVERLRRYFDGQPVEFADELDISAGSPFQQRVWQAARQIPRGETRSYQWIASRIGQPGAARAVGQALGRNPLPVIIPCHRVLASDGKLGGFSGGLEIKHALLKLEGR
jgi:methylated-DNA-[protein]-cysteine S-methyltransferase